MSQPQRHDCPVQIKPVSGGKKQFTVTTPHGEIKRTTARDYQAIRAPRRQATAYSVSAGGGVRGVSFASTLQGAYKAACGWKVAEAYFGLLLADPQPIESIGVIASQPERSPQQPLLTYPITALSQPLPQQQTAPSALFRVTSSVDNRYPVDISMPLVCQISDDREFAQRQLNAYGQQWDEAGRLLAKH